MADVKHCTASPINDFEGFLHIFYCRIKNFTESLTEKLLRQVGWQGRVQNNRNSPHDVPSPDCRVLTQTYSPNLFSSRFWWAVVSFTVTRWPCRWNNCVGVGGVMLNNKVFTSRAVDCGFGKVPQLFSINNNHSVQKLAHHKEVSTAWFS
jgi:hypothetical protein